MNDTTVPVHIPDMLAVLEDGRELYVGPRRLFESVCVRIDLTDDGSAVVTVNGEPMGRLAVTPGDTKRIRLDALDDDGRPDPEHLDLDACVRHVGYTLRTTTTRTR